MERKMKMRFTNEWLRRRIERDADLESDAGLPITNLDVLKAFVPETSPPAAARATASPAGRQSAAVLGHLLRQLRRRDKLELSRLSAEVRVPEPELRALEEGNASTLRPRTLHQLATFYRISAQALLALSPFAARRDSQLDDAAVRFATNSDDISKLTPEERKSLNEFVKYLSDYGARSADGKR
jgi:transcriptional regulator with XRE-family HTH domain